MRSVSGRADAVPLQGIDRCSRDPRAYVRTAIGIACLHAFQFGILRHREPRCSSNEFCSMDWATPLYSRGRVNRAGKALINDSSSREGWEEVFSVIGNWRSAHSYPLQTLKMVLLNRAAKVDEESFVAQRLKRITSIAGKLRDNAQMDLTQMQDIGGCRAVMQSVQNVYKLASVYKRKGKFKNAEHRPQLFEEYD